MAYTLERCDSIARELRRLVSDELQAAIERLDGQEAGEEAIHEARKSIKKARAIVKLLRRPLGSHYATANERLRGAGRHLSPLRDVHATLETLKLLHGRFTTLITPSIESEVARGLHARERKVQAQTAAMVGSARAILRQANARLPGRIEKAGAFSEVRAGVADGYRRARSAMADLTPDSDTATFHLWRRRVKDHWYHMRLFEGGDPILGARARSLKQLESDLGDDHNLSMLSALLLGDPEGFGHARTTALVLGCIQKLQHTLRRSALALGHQLFTASPTQFEAAVEPWRHPRSRRASVVRVSR